MKGIISNFKKKGKQHKILIQNFSYLSILQIFNMLVPLLTYPYLIRVLGKETYGLVIYAQVVVGYLQVFVNFGYNNLAIKEISINREDNQKLSEIFNSVLISKGCFFLFSFILLGFIIFLLPVAKDHKFLFVLCMWSALYDVIFPVWYFQGVEKMKYITYLTLTSRSIFIILIFILIKNSEHYLRVPMINGVGAIVSGLFALIIIYKKETILFLIPSRKVIYTHFKESINFFISDVSIKIFASSNKLIIGTFLGLTELAYYDLADKIVSIFRGVPLKIVRSIIYPRVAKTKNISIIKKTTTLMSIYAIITVVLINIFASKIILILGGNEMFPSLNIVRIFSILIFTTHISNYYLTVGLWSLGYIKVFRNMMIISSILYLVIYGVFVSFKIINIYTITLTPIIVDIYLISHTFLFWNLINNKKEINQLRIKKSGLKDG